VRRGAGINVPGSAALGNVAPAPGSLGTVGPGVSGLHLPGSPGIPPPLINWRRLGDEAKSMCSQVATADMLLHETLASVDQNILGSIRVGLKKEKKLPTHLIPLLRFVSTAPVLGRRYLL
jgi:hypothetical protein